MAIELQFLGGVGTVTGSKYLLQTGHKKILIDCGLFQGLKALRLKNWDGFPVNAEEIDAVVLTHAHIDHSGYIPRLIKKGFQGKIYSTAATRDLCEILLPDAGHLMEEEAKYLSDKKMSKHDPPLPLFTLEEAKASLAYFETIPFNFKKDLGDGLTIEFFYAGHILGAASVLITVNGRKIFFSGDVGRMQDKIFYPPAPPPPADYMVVESTYGNRLHPDIDPKDQLAEIVNRTFDRKGVIIIPAFAVGRAQSVMMYLSELRAENRIPALPIFLNSPMATDASGLLRKYPELHRLEKSECERMCSVATYVHSAEDSKALNEHSGPMIIISASGMLTGGRVLHHVKFFAPFRQNSIVLTGYQAAGTRGEALERGSKEIKIHGAYVPIRASVEVLENTSAHADFREMIEWLKQTKTRPRQVFVTHGEPSASDEFRRRLSETFGWNCTIPEPEQVFRLE